MDGVSRCEQLKTEVSALAASVDEYRGLLNSMAWAENVDSDVLRAKFDSLVEQGRKIRANVGELAASAGSEPPQWTDEASLQSILAQWQTDFRRQHSQYARDIYLRVASELSAASVEHPSLRIRQTLEQLVQESIGHLYELADRVDMPNPPRLFHEPRWWNDIRSNPDSLDGHVAEVQSCSASLAELLCELSRVRFFEEPAQTATVAVAEVEMPSAVEEPELKNDTASETAAAEAAGEEPPAMLESPPEVSDEAADRAEAAEASPAAEHAETPMHSPSPHLYGAPRCNRCGVGAKDITQSRMRLLEMPWRLLHKRYYRCRLCNHRFLHWV
ncbi:MAG: hypothetical protein C0483_14200 [Pirellula sp.]|nr:hypothetical protein [Pirellula sp.]